MQVLFLPLPFLFAAQAFNSASKQKNKTQSVHSALASNLVETSGIEPLTS